MKTLVLLGLAALLCCGEPAGGINVNSILDVKLADTRKQIIDAKFDPYPLPADSDSFQITLFNHTFNATVWLGEGQLRGAGTVHRTGDCFMNLTSLSPLAGELKGSMGLTGPDVKYFVGVEIGPLKEKAGIEFHIPLLQLDFEAIVNLAHLNQTKIEECAITHFVDPRIDLSGVGVIDTPVFNLLINAVTNYFHDIVQTEVSKIGCLVIKKLLDSLTAEDLQMSFDENLAMSFTEAQMLH